MTGITINGVTIPDGAIAAEVQNHPSGSEEAAIAAASRALAIREILLQEARRLDLHPEPVLVDEARRETEDDALIRQLLDREIAIPQADEQMCRRYYENNRKRFVQEDIFEASHILFSASPDDPPSYEKAVKEAEAIVRMVRERPDMFESAARERSDCPSAKDDGRLGQITRGQTVPEFEAVLFDMTEGQLCDQPVRSRFGVHVVRLDRRIMGGPLPFEAVQQKIADYLHEASWRRAVSQYIRILAGRAEIVGVDLGDNTSPLVQ